MGKFVAKKNLPALKGKKKECDRCGFDFYENELTEVGGKYYCKKCIDEED